MSSILEIPLLNPLKFYPNTANPLFGFDGAWMKERIKSFERKVDYYQKWQIGDQTPIYVKSSIIPDDLKVNDCSGEVLSILSHW